MAVKELVRSLSSATCIGARLRHPRSPAASLLRISLVLSMLILAPMMLHAQKSDFFSVSTIMRDVKSEYKLNRGDVRRLGPLIENENFDVLMIYVRFGGNEPEYSRAIWRDLISRRTDFESRLDPKLTAVQRSALRSARTAMERRVLDSLIQDYLFFVSNILELDGLEAEAIEHLFDKEVKRKHKLVLSGLTQTSRLRTDLEKISLETESWLAKILTPEQLRIYRSIATPEDKLFG
jgi:hypothetical protein